MLVLGDLPGGGGVVSPVERRLSALLNLARGAEGTPEGALAHGRAIAYAAKHAIDLALFKPDGNANTKPTSKVYRPVTSALWLADLGWAVAHYTGVRMVRSGPSWTLIGHQSDIETWTTLYERAAHEIDLEASRFVRSLDGGVSKRSEGDTFRKAASRGFGERLARYRAESEASAIGKATADVAASSTTALVLVGREVAVSGLTKSLFPRLGKQRISVSGSSDAYSAGRRFGSGLGVHKASIKS